MSQILGTTARRRLTKIFTGALTETGVSPRERGGDSATYLLVVPIEAHCHAVRLLFANHRSDVDLRICSASIYPSTSYGGAFEMHGHRLGAGDGSPVRVGPTGNSKRAVVTFGSAGRDDSLVRADSRRREIWIRGVAANVDNVRVPYKIVCSDLVPLTTLDRSDGGSQPLLFIYVHVEPYGFGRWIGPAYQPDRWCVNTKDNRGRMLFGGIAAQPDVDLTHDPSAGLFVGISGGPIFGVQYLSQVPGQVVTLSGDSLTTSPSSDSYSCAIMRAACDLSRPERPIEIANLGWGGASSSVYGSLLDRHLDLLEPSVLALQPLSRNDGSSVDALRGLLAQGLGRFEAARRRFGTMPVWFSPGCIPSWSVDPQATSMFQSLRQHLAADVIPDVDGPAIIGEDEAPWLYRDGMSDDGVHPNDRGAEALVSRARAILSELLGA